MRLAEQSSATLHLGLVHVPVPGWFTAAELAITSPMLEEEVLRREEVYLSGAAARVKEESNLTVTCKMLDGPPAQTLADHVRENGIDLVVMTTHGRGGLSRFWLGSVADRLVRHLDIPVLVIRPSESARQAPGISRILVPLDGSALAESILDPLRTLAEVTGAQLVLTMAVEPVPTLLPTFPYPVEVEPTNIEEREAVARRYLAEVGARIETRGIIVHERVARGGAPREIIRLADEEGCDLIAMATHGASGLDRMVFGSVTDRVIRSSAVPVMVLRPTGYPDQVRDLMRESGMALHETANGR